MNSASAKTPPTGLGRVIEDTHGHLYDLIGQVARHAAMPEQVGPLIAQLGAKAEDHFREEEQVMERIAYPEMDAHCQAHAAFCRSLRNLKAACGGEAAVDAAEIAAMADRLRDWLTNHFETEDARLMAYTRQYGAGPGK